VITYPVDNTPDGRPPYDVAVVMDFIWDKNGNNVYKTTYWWDVVPQNDPRPTQVIAPACRYAVLGEPTSTF
jgi:hypothetical protein